MTKKKVHRGILLILVVLVAWPMQIHAQVESSTEQLQWVKIALLDHAGYKDEHEITPKGLLGISLVSAPNDVLFTSDADLSYTLKMVNITGYRSSESKENWWQFEEVHEPSQSIPLVLSEGVYHFTLQQSPKNYPAYTLEGVGVYQSGQLIALVEDKHVQLVGLGGRLTQGRFSYRGALIPMKNQERKVFLVNHLPLEHYLYGVLAKEMPPSWPTEALKAQAVAARTYAYSQLGRFASRGYDMVDGVQSQVYRGVSAEDPRTTAAVNATYGQRLYYNNKLITAFYHSNSGGHTEDSENVFSEALPYIRAVKDPYSLGHPGTQWSISYTKDELSKVLSSSGNDVGIVIDVISRSATPSGRVSVLEIKGTKSSITLEKEATRRILGYSQLKSMLFNVSKGDTISVLSKNGQSQLAMDKLSVLGANGKTIVSAAAITNGITSFSLAKQEKDFSFIGSGFGHGLGMSQFGAKRMAELNMTYDAILTFYYTNVTLAN